MSTLNIFKRILAWGSHARTRSQLQELDDRSLADIGISRELLAQGVRAWPWRAADDEEAWSPLSRSRRYAQFTHALAEQDASKPAEPLEVGPVTDSDRRHAA